MGLAAAAHRHWKSALAVFGGWTLFGFLLGEQVYGLRVDANPLTGVLSHAIIFEVTYCWAWATLTPLIFLLGRRFPIESSTWVRHLPIQLLASLFMAALTKAAHVAFFDALRLGWFPVLPVSMLLRSVAGTLDYGAILYWVVLLVGHALDSLKRHHADQVHKSQLQAQLAEAQLRAVRMQLHPHFLFNALNSLAELIHQDARAADRMLTRLSELLRIFLKSSEAHEVSLEEEIDFLRRYLEIQQIRFEERLTVEIAIDADTRAAAVPSLILQPLVENAIVHGIRNRSDGWIGISSHRENGSLYLSVADNGNGQKALGTFGPEGVGLQSTRLRLKQVYAGDFAFQLERRADGGAAAEITIPFRVTASSHASHSNGHR